MQGKFQFRGVLGIDYEKRKSPDHFKTWNGKKTVYILDEDQTPMGISTIPGSRDSQPLEPPKYILKRRKHAVKKSRKRKRRKRKK